MASKVAVSSTQGVKQVKRKPKSSSPKIARFEDLDPKTHRFYFDQRRVYADGTEYSFEQLRAIQWFKKKKKDEEKERTAKLEAEVEQLRNQLAKLQKHLSKGSNGVSSMDSSTEGQTVVRTPLKERNVSELTGPSRRTRNHEHHIAVAAVSGNTVPRVDVFDDHMTGIVPVVKPSKPNFEIFCDEPTQAIDEKKEESMMVPVIPPKKPDFEIFRDEPTAMLDMPDETTNMIAVIPPKKPDFEIFVDETQAIEDEKESNGDSSKSWGLDFSVNPIRGFAEMGANFGGKTEGFTTFLLPTETEFISKHDFYASTPAAPGNKKHHTRVAPKNTTKKDEEITGKLETIVETSREYKSSSSSSSSGAHTTTAGFTRTRSRFPSGIYDATAVSNPFDDKLIESLLDDLDEPLERRKGFFVINKNLPKIKEANTKLCIGNDKFIVCDLKDEGNYAKVYASQLESICDEVTGYSTAMSEIEFNKWFALKISKPANRWEFYICDEVHRRRERIPGPDIELSIMMASPAAIYRDASVLVDELCQNGTLMKVVNLYKKNKKSFPKSMTAFFALELLLILKQIHACQIIHADVKPDNVLVLNFPTKEEVLNVDRRTCSLKIIDFGRGIDMSLFPEKTAFTHFIETKGSACPEMHDKKAWTYEPDWYGFLDCLHIMIFQEYIDVIKEHNRWILPKKVNKRTHLKEIWEPLFDALLNLDQTENKACPPVVDETIEQLKAYTKEHLDEIYRESMEMESFVDN